MLKSAAGLVFVFASFRLLTDWVIRGWGFGKLGFLGDCQRGLLQNAGMMV